MWSVFSLDACNLLNLEIAAEFSTSCRIRAVSAAKLQNLIKTGYNVLKTTTNHNQIILENFEPIKAVEFYFCIYFFIFFIESIEEMKFILSPIFFFNNSFSDPPDHTECRRRAYSRIIIFSFFYLTIFFLILQITQSARGEHTQESLTSFFFT